MGGCWGKEMGIHLCRVMYSNIYILSCLKCVHFKSQKIYICSATTNYKFHVYIDSF